MYRPIPWNTIVKIVNTNSDLDGLCARVVGIAQLFPNSAVYIITRSDVPQVVPATDQCESYKYTCMVLTEHCLELT